jgi:thioredoxin 1
MERLTAADFDGTTLARDGVLAVAFAADWCPYCRDFMAGFEAATLPVPAAMGDVTDEESALWDDFELEVVPTLVLFRDGVAVWRRDGRRKVGLLAALRGRGSYRDPGLSAGDIDALRAAL